MKIGDKVFYTKYYRNLEITNINNGKLVEISGEQLTNKPYSDSKIWIKITRTLL